MSKSSLRSGGFRETVSVHECMRFAVNFDDSSICGTDNQGVIVSIRSAVDGSIVSLCPTSNQKGMS